MPKPGPRPRDPSGSASPVAIRLAPAVVAAATAAAEAAGKQMRTWAADVIRDAAEAHGPRFASLDEVVAYVDGLPADDRAELAWRIASRLLRRPEHLRLAIVQAWLAGDRGEIAGACESWARGER